MPQRKPKTDSGLSDLDKLLGGKDAAGRFLKRTVQIEKMSSVIRNLAAQQDKARKSIDKASRAAIRGIKKENVLLRGKDALHRKISKSQGKQIAVITKAAKQREKQLRRETTLVKKNLRIESKLNRTRQQLGRRRGRGGRGGGGLGLGGIGLGLGALGLGALAVSQIKNITERRLETFLNLGRGATSRIGGLGGRGIASSTKFAALNQFQGEGVTQFIQGQSAAIQAGILRAQKDLSKLGPDVANRLLANLSRSFGVDVQGRRQFLEVTGRSGISAALDQFRSQQNFPEFTRAQNALSQTQDPTLQIRGDFARVIEQMKDSFERLVVTVGGDLIPIIEKLVPKFVELLQWVSDLTSKDLLKGAGIGAAVLIGGRVAAGLAIGAGGAALRGGGRLAVAGVTRGVPAVGRGAVAAGRGALAAGRLGVAGAGALPGIAAAGGLAAGAVLAAPIALGGGIAIHASERRNEALRDALSAQGRASQGVGNLDTLAKRLKASATSPRQGLVAERLRLDSLLSSTLNPRQRERQGKRRRDVQKQIDLLDKRRAVEEKSIEAKKSETKAVKAATKSAEKFAKDVKAPARGNSIAAQIERRASLELPKQLADSVSGIRREELGTARLSQFGSKLALDELEALNVSLRSQQNNLREILSTFDEDDPRGIIEANQTRTQIAAIERELKANQITARQAQITVQSSETDLRRQEFALRRLSPLGTIGAFPELQSINASLRDEISILEKMAASQELSVLEQINVKKAVLSRRLEVKQNQRAFLDAFRDAAISQALGAGRFSKLLFTRDQNVGVGLRKGIYGIPKDVSRALLGNVDPSVVPRIPRTALEILGRASPFAGVNKLHPRTQLVNPRPGATSGESMVNVGRFMVHLGEQMKQENEGIQNQIGEPITKYAGNRLGPNVQPG